MDWQRTSQQEQCRQAAHALVAGVRNNVHLLDLFLDGLMLAVDALDEIEFYLDLNRRCGRHLLTMQHSVPTALWCYLLARYNSESSVLFFYVNELPFLTSGQGLSVDSASTVK